MKPKHQAPKAAVPVVRRALEFIFRRVRVHTVRCVLRPEDCLALKGHFGLAKVLFTTSHQPVWIRIGPEPEDWVESYATPRFEVYEVRLHPTQPMVHKLSNLDHETKRPKKPYRGIPLCSLQVCSLEDPSGRFDATTLLDMPPPGWPPTGTHKDSIRGLYRMFGVETPARIRAWKEFGERKTRTADERSADRCIDALYRQGLVGNAE